MLHFTEYPGKNKALALANRAMQLKGGSAPDDCSGKSMTTVYFNPSLRTRMSTHCAAANLGIHVMDLDVASAWNMEFTEGAVMNGDRQEHIKDAVRVLSGYSDLLAVRSFPTLSDRAADYSEQVLGAFTRFSEVPVVSLESATRHPLQSLADVLTIAELQLTRPKVAVTWAPHPRTLPQAVVNSFLEWSACLDARVVLAHPPGYELSGQFTSGIEITHDQDEALRDADVVYCKNWSSYSLYGTCPTVDSDWMMTEEKMAITNNASFMHCLPIRRNVVATDEVVDNSIVYQQAGNRIWAAEAVLENLLSNHGNT